MSSTNLPSVRLERGTDGGFRYKSLRPRSIDLVGDYAGQELFLVEGDSLLLECFSNVKIDFDCRAPYPLDANVRRGLNRY